MPLYASEGQSGPFEQVSEGVQQAVCADVIDLGVQPGFEGKPTPKVELVFQVSETGKDGKRLELVSWFTRSMHEKATLRKFLESWRGRKFELGEAGQFDLETLIGKNCQIGVIHQAGKDNRTWARIQSVLPLLKGMPELKVEGYVRRERKPKDQGQAQAQPQAYQIPKFMQPKPGEPF